jgi:hypothetical protein
VAAREVGSAASNPVRKIKVTASRIVFVGCIG